MADRILPGHPNLEQYRNQAKDLLKAFRSGNSEALSRIGQFHQRFKGLSESELQNARFRLTDAQLVIAREHGLESWPRFKQEVESMASDQAVYDELKDEFIRLVKEGEAKELGKLLNDHPELEDQINEPLFSFDSPAVVFAASRSLREMIDVLLDHGADVNAKSQWWAGGFGVLENADGELLDHLVNRGAEIGAHAAAKLGDLERLQELIEADPSQAHALGGDGKQPLHYASSREIVDYLLDQGAEVDARDVDHGSTPAQHAVGEDLGMCRYLVEKGAEVDMFMACALGDVELVKKVLEDDPDSLSARVGKGKLTSGESKGGHTYIYTKGIGYTARPLQVASDWGHPGVVEFLLQHSTERDQFLHFCVQADEEAVKRMTARKPDLVKSLSPCQERLIL